MATAQQLRYGVNVTIAIGFLIAFVVMIFLAIVEIRVLNKRLDEINTTAKESLVELEKLTGFFG